MVKVFVVDDDQVYATTILFRLEKHKGLEITHFETARECIDHLHENPDIITIDFYLPDATGLDLLKKVKKYNDSIQTVVISGQEELDVVVQSYNEGAYAYIIKNENAIVELDNVIKHLVSTITLQQELESLREKVFERNKYENILGDSESMLKVLKLVQKVENKAMQVLITGESGTGKELIAQAIHYNSPRKKKRFVTVNMGAIPLDLVESELFGHEKGAFTGASSRRIGKFEEADRGTIFLDEIGEVDLDIQKKLLRVLQENEVTRLGSNKPIKLDLRVVAATNKNLAEEVQAGRFREDLFYRLQGFLIHIPPLRERNNDILLLAKSFLEEYCKNNKMDNKKISHEAMETLLSYDWPGNVRELKSLIERAALMADRDTIIPDDLLFSTQSFKV